jgi:hypothetical protein
MRMYTLSAPTGRAGQVFFLAVEKAMTIQEWLEDQSVTLWGSPNA